MSDALPPPGAAGSNTGATERPAGRHRADAAAGRQSRRPVGEPLTNRGPSKVDPEVDGSGILPGRGFIDRRRRDKTDPDATPIASQFDPDAVRAGVAAADALRDPAELRLTEVDQTALLTRLAEEDDGGALVDTTRPTPARETPKTARQPEPTDTELRYASLEALANRLGVRLGRLPNGSAVVDVATAEEIMKYLDKLEDGPLWETRASQPGGAPPEGSTDRRRRLAVERLVVNDGRFSNALIDMIRLGQAGKDIVAKTYRSALRNKYIILGLGGTGAATYAGIKLVGLPTAATGGGAALGALPAIGVAAGGLAAAGAGLYAGEATVARSILGLANLMHRGRLRWIKGNPGYDYIKKSWQLMQDPTVDDTNLLARLEELKPPRQRYLEAKIKYNQQRAETMGIFRSGIRALLRRERMGDRRMRKAELKVMKQQIKAMKPK